MRTSICDFQDTQLGLPQVLKMIVGSFMLLITLGTWADSSVQKAPTANFTAIPNPFDRQRVFLDAELSFDPDGTIESYKWLASNGQTADSQKTTLIFDSNDIFTIALLVIDNDGLTDIMLRTLSVGNEKMKCSSHATYINETQELLIPFVTLLQLDPFTPTSNSENTMALYTVALQSFRVEEEVRFRIQTDSLAFVEMTTAIHPCHAIYLEKDQILHIPFIDITTSLGASPDSVFQATLQPGENGVLTIKTLTQLE